MAEVQKIKNKKNRRKKSIAQAEEDAKKAIAEAEEGANKSMAEAEEGAKKSMAEAEEEGAPSFERSIDTPHPSEHSWTFLFDDPSSRSNKKPSTTWGSNIQPIHSFSTLEEFWCLYSDNLHPTKLAVGANFYCFKYKIKPIWEDPVCANGGKWTVSCARGKSDTWWLHTLLAMIREQFDYGDEICGAAVYVRRKEERISLWTKNASNEATQIIIGKQWKEFMDYNDTIGFTFHDDAKKKSNRDVKNHYVI